MIASNANSEHTPIISCVNYLRTVDGPVFAQHSISLCYFNLDIKGTVSAYSRQEVAKNNSLDSLQTEALHV